LQNFRNHLRSGIKVTISFYMPESCLPSPDRRAAWEQNRVPALLSGGKPACAQAWLYQTWVELRDLAPVELVTSLPDAGTIVTLGNFLAPDFRAKPGQFLADVVADFVPHPGAQFHIVQNRAHLCRLPDSAFIPHWPQPNLVPRDPRRGDRIENVAFFGDRPNLAPELATDAFAADFHRATGAAFFVREAARWHDYSDVDVAIAIRDFTAAQHLRKPPTKLSNAWLAKVPLIAGRDSAFAAEGKSGRDFLTARSPADVIRLVNQLKDNPTLRRQIVSAGEKKSAVFTRDAIRETWRSLCAGFLPEAAARWLKKSPTAQNLFWLTRKSVLFLDRTIRS
jgi:hypothetical protein